MACLFILLTVAFEEQKSLILMKYNLSFFLMDYVFGVGSLPYQCYKNFSPRILGFTFRSIIHFEIIFVYCARHGALRFYLVHFFFYG